MVCAEGEEGAEGPRKRGKGSHAMQAAAQGEQQQQHADYENVARLAQVHLPEPQPLDLSPNPQLRPDTQSIIVENLWSTPMHAPFRACRAIHKKKCSEVALSKSCCAVKKGQAVLFQIIS